MDLFVSILICVVIFIYVVLVIVVLCFRSYLASHDICTDVCPMCKCGTPNSVAIEMPKCEKCAECCNYQSPDFRQYINSICPSRTGVHTSRCTGCGTCIQISCDSCAKLGTFQGPTCQCDTEDILTCQNCTSSNVQCCPCCNVREPLVDCGVCNCRCGFSSPDCQEINCLCFKLHISPVEQDDSADL